MRNRDWRRLRLLLGMVGLVAAAGLVLVIRGDRIKPGDPTGLPPLHAAVTLEDFGKVEALLAGGTPVDESGPEGNTPLHYARSKRMVELLFANGADRYARNQQKETPLHNVRMKGAIEALLEAGADPNARDEVDETPLHDSPNEELVALLSAAGAEIDPRDIHGNTPLHVASNSGVARALLRHGAEREAKNTAGHSPLGTARNGDIVRVLVKAGANVGESGGYSPALHNHISMRRPTSLRALLECGANPNVPDPSGSTPLMKCRRSSEREICKLLLSAGADPNIAPEGWGKINLLGLAFRSRDWELAELYLRHGATLPSPRSWAYITDSSFLLVLAGLEAAPETLPLAGVDDPKGLKRLIRLGAKVNPRRGSGLREPIHYAPSVETLRILLASGARPNPHTPNPEINGELTALYSMLKLHHDSPEPGETLDQMLDVLLPITKITSNKDLDYFKYCKSSHILERLLSAGVRPRNKGRLMYNLLSGVAVVGDEHSKMLRQLVESERDRAIMRRLLESRQSMQPLVKQRLADYLYLTENS